MTNPISSLLLFSIGIAATAQQPNPDAIALQRRTWQVAGVERQALVHVPAIAATEASPLVFVFHGHGGGMQNAARSFHLHEEWPQAIVVYAQGLPTATARDADGDRSGWQPKAGAEGDRDLQFVDAMLTSLRQEQRIDPRHIHATGHSNGGGFCYLLWACRGEQFASFAPSAAGAAGKLRGQQPPPRPILHLAGRGDQVVRFAQQQRTIDALIERHGAGPGEPWPEVPGATRHRATNGADVATIIHDGGHEFLASAPASIAAFFRATARQNPWLTPAVRGPGLVQHVYASERAGAEVSYHVWLPPDYMERDEPRYPVIYWLHGSGGGTAGIAPVANLFATAIERGALPPALLVFPNGLPNGMWCNSVDGRTPVESILVEEIVPRIDSLFRTVATRDGRAFAGFSMGGYGALRLGFAHSDMVATIASLGGGPLQRELLATPRANDAQRAQLLRTVYGGEMAAFVDRSPWQLAIHHAEAKRPTLRILQALGDADETLPANRAFHAHLQSLDIAHDYIELGATAHDPLRTLHGLDDRLWHFLRDGFAAAGR
ncbi:MAG: alpha/beta hydrolase-fold protein [Planctomycetes bacterium]|jgi:polyhydroxybutyrate depolymerase|nr:alpha/beta hydrolase-fold protein [Planctomycetota bacterium]